jgi:hypothetical protein
MTSFNRHTPRTSLVAAALLGLALLAGCSSQQKAQQVEDRPAAFWPPYPDEPRIQFLVSYNQNTDVEPSKSKFDQLLMGKEPEQVLGLNKPYGVGMWNGRIYTTDLRKGTVTIFDLRKHQVLLLGKSMGDTLRTPVDIAIAPDGMKYVVDMGEGTVAIYDPQDRRAGQIAKPGMKPAAVALYQNDLYVSDFQSQSVLVFDRATGQFTRSVGRAGSGGEGEFVRPLGIDVDKDGNLYVADVMQCTLQKFDRTGKVVATLSGMSAMTGGLVRPKHIAVDKDGTVFVVDAAFQNVQLFTPKGQVYTFFGSAGGHPGAMNLPAGIDVHEGDLDLFEKYIHPGFQAERLLIVTNQFGDNKVSVYAMGRLKPGVTVAQISRSKGMVPPGTLDPNSLKGVPTTVPTEEPGATTDAPHPTTPVTPPTAAPNAQNTPAVVTPAGATSK